MIIDLDNGFVTKRQQAIIEISDEQYHITGPLWG